MEDCIEPKQHTVWTCCCVDMNLVALLITFPFNIIFNSLVLLGVLAYFGNKWVRGALLAYMLFLWFLDRAPYHGRWLYNICGLPESLRNTYLQKLVAGHYMATLRRTVPLLAAEGPYIFTCQPHGIFGVAHQSNFGTDSTGFSNLFPDLKIKLLGGSALFRIPFAAEWWLMNGVGSVDKKVCLSSLKNGISIALAPGGAQEALVCEPGKMRILKARKGFCKLALETGAAIVPVIAFGENELYIVKQFAPDSIGRKLQEKFKNCFGFTPPLFSGRWWAPLLPKKTTLSTVVGRPIRLNKHAAGRAWDNVRSCGGFTTEAVKTQPLDATKTQPLAEPAQVSTEDVEALHELYCQELRLLFETYKAEHGAADMQLEFVD